MLELQHAYHLPPRRHTVALVDVNVVLESLKREDMQVGAWVNVIGYVEEVLKEPERGQRQEQEQEQEQGKTGLVMREGDRVCKESRAVRVRVQAVILWNAGGVKVGVYERTLEERLKLEKVSRKRGA